MRHSLLHRASATLLSLLFLLAWGEPAALHPCPMHDGGAAAVVAEHGGSHGARAAAAPAPGDAHAASSHQHGAPSVAAPASEATPHADSHLCSCLGHGCCAAGVVLAPSQALRWRVVVTRRAEPPAPAAVATALVRAPHALPFANGPPALA